MKKRIALVLAALCLPLLAYLCFWPVPLDPAVWEAPAPPAMTGVYAPNQLLRGATRFELDDGLGPEDIAVDAEGRFYGGLEDGRIVRFEADGGGHSTFADTGGRPLGLHFDAAGNLIVADAYKGLLQVDPAGAVTVLAIEADGVPLGFTDDLDIGADGTIYFSDASVKFRFHQYKIDGLEHRPNGRLLAYDPATGAVRTLLEELYFANGVAVSPDQSFVLVNETWKYRIKRYWLQGARAGEAEILIDNLPGFPDGVSSNGRDTFWVAMASPRNTLVDRLAPYPFLRKMVVRLPEAVQPKPAHYAFVLGLDGRGRVTHNLQAPSGKPFAHITSVEEHGGYLYLGSLHETAAARIAAPGATNSTDASETP
ncbi:SMP-30/gluconolactonase/LRE family protein [Acanthopleuribacter pedis]|uniref:SMP-30/gluconolactonase/LRE family protein n=1 Tax=Acanthopleuribacter pedis TaxID=442870 RepID=A0A8J7QN06_9BACT|nr:SMP-30/gluconolactonase/LRE family protein [Acanthopleuribacter pedis]MBO1321398.1 SMP-30/gluconolactonase/LRE family protein [Acanthopleuribacter pedis]